MNARTPFNGYDELMEKLSHLDSAGRAKMVDVGDKTASRREAVAAGVVRMRAGTLRAIVEGKVPKGEVLAVARVAAIMAAKHCGDLIPLCHPLPLESIEVSFDWETLLPSDEAAAVEIRIEAVARVTAKTGVEMESLTAVSVAGLTIYDMCKAIDKGMTIEGVRLVRKSK